MCVGAQEELTLGEGRALLCLASVDRTLPHDCLGSRKVRFRTPGGGVAERRLPRQVGTSADPTGGVFFNKREHLPLILTSQATPVLLVH